MSTKNVAANSARQARFALYPNGSDPCNLPDPALDMSELRWSDFGVQMPSSRQASPNVRPDLQVERNRLTNRRFTASLTAAMMYGGFEGLMAQAFNRDLHPAVNFTASDVTAVAAGNKLTSATATAFDDFRVGDLVWLSGVTGLVGRMVLVTAVSSSPAEISFDAGYVTLADVAAGFAVRIHHDGLLYQGGAGDVVPRAALIEDARTDIGRYRHVLGAYLNQLQINQAFGDSGSTTIQAAWDAMGGDRTNATVGSGTLAAAIAEATNPTFDPASFRGFREGGTLYTVDDLEVATQCNFQIATANDQRTAGGTLSPVGITKQTYAITGTYDVSEDDDAAQDLQDKAHDDIDSSLGWEMHDGQGRAYGHLLPSVQYTSADGQTGGSGTSVIQMPWQASISPTFGYTAMIARFSETPA